MAVVSGGFLLFVACVLFVYYWVPGRLQWTVLLAASFLFYSAQGLKSLVYILLTVLTTYGAGLLIGRYQSRLGIMAAKRKARPWLIACLAANFGLLFGCKVNLLQGGLLPLGISFYLFQSTGYLIDLFRGTVKPQRNPGKLALFISFFPQLIQGPISRASDLLPKLTEPHPLDGKQLSFGLQRMLWGYFKELVVAQRLAPAVMALQSAEGSLLLLGVLYAFRIYADFTGGIDIALGLSEAMGIGLPENFCRPFFAKNTAEFWRRWHITLGEWMKDYIFYPISVSKPMRRLGKAARKRLGKFGKRLPVYVASLTTWLATGIWHGLTPNFVLWGMMNCGVIIVSEELSPLYAKFYARFSLKARRGYGIFEMLRTFLLMSIIRLADLFPDVRVYFRRMCMPFSFPKGCSLGLSGWDWGILLAAAMLLLSVSLLQEKLGSLREVLWKSHWLLRNSLFFGLLLLVLLMGCYGIGYHGENFIYSNY